VSGNARFLRFVRCGAAGSISADDDQRSIRHSRRTRDSPMPTSASSANSMANNVFAATLIRSWAPWRNSNT